MFSEFPLSHFHAVTKSKPKFFTHAFKIFFAWGFTLHIPKYMAPFLDGAQLLTATK